MDVPSIPEYFRNKEIFITGGSGFLGKALLEVILRTCPDFKVIYLLLRSKKGVKSEDRLQQVLNNALFDTVRRANPDVLRKLQVVSGDVSELRLGLSEGDRARLYDVQIVFHAAASVRFDDPLKKATLMNTRGTREVMELMLEMPRLEVGVHVSTTYSNTKKVAIEERVYRDHGDWKEAIRVAENFEDEYVTQCLTKKILAKMQNTYTYTKHLGENVVEDYSDRLPLVLFRPGIIISTWKDPIPGWHDNFYGPIGFGIAVGKGVLRTFFMAKDALQDYMPVDMVVKSMLIATWNKAVNLPHEILPTYNCSVQGRLTQSNEQCGKSGVRACTLQPYNDSLWYPIMQIYDNELVFRAQFILKHAIPGLLVDAALKCSGRKPMLMKLFRKMFYAVLTMSEFMFPNWNFRCEKMWDLNNKLKPEDRKAFEYSFEGYNLDDYLVEVVKGSKRFILNEPENHTEAMRRHKRNAIIHYVFLTLWYGVIMYFILTSSYFARMTSLANDLMELWLY